MAMIFLSYSREDLATMHLIKQALQQTGASVWTDENLTPGTSNWTKAIDKSLRECDAIVTLLSPTAYHSKWVDSECGKATAYGKEIFPILIEGDPRDAIPLSLWGIQRIDLRKDFDGGVKELIEALQLRGYSRADLLINKQDQITSATVGEINVIEASVSTGERKKREPGNDRTLFRRIAIVVFIGLVLTAGVFLLNNLGVLNIDLGEKSIVTFEATEILDTHVPEEEKPIVVGLAATPEPVSGMGLSRVSEFDGMEMVYVPEGTFTMGTTDADIYKLLSENLDWERSWIEDEQPTHEVYLDGFWIDKYEVTNALYAICVAAGVCHPPKQRKYYNDSQYTSHPVVYVNWNYAKVYCEWVGRRLPSEAEWEKAARGVDGRTYPWGESINCNYAQYSECDDDTIEVGGLPKGSSPYGAMDMAGNVREWTADWYDAEYYDVSPKANPTGSSSGELHVMRGGSWDSIPGLVRSADRDVGFPEDWYEDLGFRCAISP